MWTFEKRCRQRAAAFSRIDMNVPVTQTVQKGGEGRSVGGANGIEGRHIAQINFILEKHTKFNVQLVRIATKIPKVEQRPGNKSPDGVDVKGCEIDRFPGREDKVDENLPLIVVVNK